MTAGRQVRAVTFDLDGTLYSSSAMRRRYLFRNLFRMRPVRVIRRVRDELRGRVFDTGDDFFAAQHAAVAARLECSEAEAARVFDEMLSGRLCDVLDRIGPRSDARQALERAQLSGLKVGVISDYAVDDKLRALGLDEVPWAARVAADAVGALKPHPRAWQVAAEAMGVAPEEIVHVGDREDTDLHGAEVAGARGVLLDTVSGPALSLYDAVTLALSLAERGRDAD